MDGWLKVLIAVACLVVIIGSGFYGYTQYEAHTVRSEQAQRLTVVRQSLYDRLGVKEGETDKVRNLCASFSRDPAKDSEPVKDVLSKCRMFGYL